MPMMMRPMMFSRPPRNGATKAIPIRKRPASTSIPSAAPKLGGGSAGAAVCVAETASVVAGARARADGAAHGETHQDRQQPELVAGERAHAVPDRGAQRGCERTESER